MQTVSHNEFPFFLIEIPKLPTHLYYEGDVSLLKRRCITIVGTRSITQYGKWCIDNLLGKFLQDLDIAVVSGLARGVDAYVHRTCLDRGIKTIAIIQAVIILVSIECFESEVNLFIFKSSESSVPFFIFLEAIN